MPPESRAPAPGFSWPRALAGAAAAAMVLGVATYLAGPAKDELIVHTDGLPYVADSEGRIDIPFDLSLREQKPEVVVLGSSVVECAFDEALFEDLVGIEALDMTISGSMSAVWYLLIKNRIAHAEPKPKVCILGFRDTYLTVPEYRVEGGYQTIIDRYVDGPEPLLDRLAYHSDVGPVEYFLKRHWSPIQRKSEIVAGTQALAKERLAGALIGRTDEEMRQAIDLVFADDRKIPSKLTAAQQRAESVEAGDYFDFEKESKESFLPEMIRICKEEGIELVLMRMRPRRNAEFPDDRSHFPRFFREDIVEYSRDLDAYLAESGVRLLDFSEDTRIPFEWFANGDHLNEDEGKEGFTRLLAEAVGPIVGSQRRPGDE